jgi:hypothetical protein
VENEALASNRGAFFSPLAIACAARNLAFAGNLPEFENPDQAFSLMFPGA